MGRSGVSPDDVSVKLTGQDADCLLATVEWALRGVGDATLGEWRERGPTGICHVRRRLTDAERELRKPRLEVRDIRGTEEEQQRFRRLFREAPHARRYIGA